MDQTNQKQTKKSKLHIFLILTLTFIGGSAFFLSVSYLILLNKSLDRQGYYVHPFIIEEHLAPMFYTSVAVGFLFFIWRCIKITINTKKEKLIIEGIQLACMSAFLISTITFMTFVNTQIRFELLKTQDINVILEDATLDKYGAYSASRAPYYEYKNAQFSFIKEQGASLLKTRHISDLYATSMLIKPIEPPYYDLQNLSRVELEAGLSPLFAFYYLVTFQFFLATLLNLCVYLTSKMLPTTNQQER